MISAEFRMSERDESHVGGHICRLLLSRWYVW